MQISCSNSRGPPGAGSSSLRGNPDACSSRSRDRDALAIGAAPLRSVPGDRLVEREVSSFRQIAARRWWSRSAWSATRGRRRSRRLRMARRCRSVNVPSAHDQSAPDLSPTSATAAGNTRRAIAERRSARPATAGAGEAIGALLRAGGDRFLPDLDRGGCGMHAVEQFAQARFDVFADRVADEVVRAPQPRHRPLRRGARSSA